MATFCLRASWRAHDDGTGRNAPDRPFRWKEWELIANNRSNAALKTIIPLACCMDPGPKNQAIEKNFVLGQTSFYTGHLFVCPSAYFLQIRHKFRLFRDFFSSKDA
jgi:hypothetical protein